MQNRYVGDIGDYAKYSLLRALARGCKLGVSWYLFPDEDSGDGGHIGYLLRPDKWRAPDPKLFDTLQDIMGRIFLKKLERSVAVVEQWGLLPGSTAFWRCMTVPQECKGGRWGWRSGGKGTCAVRWRPVSPRTFFILNCTDELRRRAEEWCQQWELPKHVYFQGYAVELDEPG